MGDGMIMNGLPKEFDPKERVDMILRSQSLNSSIAENRSYVDSVIRHDYKSEKKVNYALGVYLYQNEMSLTLALNYLNKAIELQENDLEVYWYKATIQRALGDKAGAIATAQLFKNQAEKSHNGFYLKLNQELMRALK